MARRVIPFANNEVYHVILRSVEGIPIFKNDTDYFRAITGLYEFNDKKPVSIWQRRRERKNEQNVQGPTLHILRPKRELLVDILAFCLMPNHIHLLLKQRVDDGVTQFARKFATGYAMYFNKRYERMGHLFQGAFRAVYVENDAQLNVVFVYIHANPVSIIFPKYKEVGIDNADEAMNFLKNYRWSSYQDYIGQKNFPSVTERKFLLDVIGNRDQIEERVKSWLEYKAILLNETIPSKSDLNGSHDL